MRFFGYDRAALLKKFTPADDDALARQYVDLLRQGKLELVEERLDPSIKNQGIRDTLSGMYYIIPSGEPISIKTVDARIVRGKDSSSSGIILEYEFAPQIMSADGTTELRSGSFLLAQVLVRTESGVKTIAGLHVLPTSKSFEEMNEFTFVDKGLSQYLGLCLAAAVAALTLWTFIACIKTKMGKKKWLWLLLIVIGVLRLTVDWTSGQWSVSPLTILAPPVRAYCSLYGPWSIEVTIPLGAIAFLLWKSGRAPDVHVSQPLDGIPEAKEYL
jgi:hypothetical protein